MKLSEAMLKGYEKVDGRNAIGDYFRGGTEEAPHSVCPFGAILLGATGRATPDYGGANYALVKSYKKFVKTWGFPFSELNDEGMPWEHIYGMARAAGL